MPLNAEPLQVDEVVKALSQREGCTLVHIDSGQEVDIYKGSGDEARPWVVRYSHYEILDKTVLKQALALGLELRDPCPDSRDRRYELYRHVMGIRATAIKALSLARLLPGVPEDAWLWVTVYEYDERDEPPAPPNPWPPAGT
jgi:hypothetical protein